MATRNLYPELEPRLIERLGSHYDDLFRGRTTITLLEEDVVRIGCESLEALEHLQAAFQGTIEAVLAEIGMRQARVVFAVVAELFQAQRAKERQTVEAPPERALPAELFLPNPDGHGLAFHRMRLNAPVSVLFLSAPEVLYQHYDDGYRICTGQRCTRCPQARHRCGYADAFLISDGGRRKDQRVIETLSESALFFLTEQAARIRGCQAQFLRRTKFEPFEVKIIEAEVKLVLPEPINLRRPLMRRFHLAKWPVYDTPLFEE